jgi:tripeptide aminopeptidase
MTDTLLDRFLRYVAIGTSSDDKSQDCPSTPGQLILASTLAEELMNMGLTDAAVDENGYVTATIPSNTEADLPVIGLIAHLDTSPEMPGNNVKPIITQNYSGNDIILDEENGIVLSPGNFPELTNYIGQTIISTDGSTLLGADNKAGIAEIMTAAWLLSSEKERKHGTVKICFTPDEEIGRGANRFNVKKFGADFAYTVDGGPVGSLEYETFNAATATITVQGRSIHPGSAKNQMVNSISIAQEFCRLLPAAEKPEHTEGYEGYYHVYDFHGGVDKTTMRILLRDHSQEKFNEKKRRITSIADYLNSCHDIARVNVNLRDEYFNMRKMIEPYKHIVEWAEEAVRNCGIEPLITPVRGGTDGARLSYMGLPCPNIFTGGHNFHGRYEYIPLQSMEAAVKVILEIIKIVTLRGAKR